MYPNVGFLNLNYMFFTSILIFGGLVNANEMSVSDGKKKHVNRLLEEVLVTAQKREENLKEVPISMNAFSAGELDAKHVLNIGDLPKITPGLTITSQLGFTSLFIRGIGTDAFILSDPLVVRYVDNIYFPVSVGATQDFGNVESIEVLKGPQGTLFGRNALGGAIRVRTKNPSFDEIEGKVSVTRAGYNTNKVVGFLSAPIFDSLAFSLSGLEQSMDNVNSGFHGPAGASRRASPSYEKSYRAKIFWQPSDSFQIDLNYYGFETETSGPFAGNSMPSNLGTLIGIGEQPRRNSQNNDYTYSDVVADTFFGNLEWTTSMVDVKLMVSDQSYTYRQSADFDGSPVPAAAFIAGPMDSGISETETAELQILAGEDAPFSEWLDWIFGVYYFKSISGYDPSFLNVGGVSLSQNTIGGISLPGNLLSTVQGLIGNLPVSPDSLQFKITGLLATDSIAYFSQATIDLTSSISLTLGARYQVEERLVDKSSSGLVINDEYDDIQIQSYNGYDNPDYRDESKSFDPKISINYKPESGWLGESPLLYATYQTAATSLSFNTLNIYDPPEKVRATKITSYEIGYKSRFFDGVVDFNSAIFFYDLVDPQVQTISLIAGGAVLLENAESQETYGAEFDLTTPLFPKLTNETLVFTLGVSYVEAEYTKYTNGVVYDDTTGLYQNNGDHTGNKPVKTPPWTITAGLLQAFNTSLGPIEVGLNYYYNDGFYYLPQNGEKQFESAYETLGINVSFLWESINTRLSLFGKNVLNEDYNVSSYTTDFGTSFYPAPLRTYGAQLTVEF